MELEENVTESAKGRHPTQLLSLKSLCSRPPTTDTPTTKTQPYFTQMKQKEYILIQVAFSAGLGSIWRFPYLCHRNGGGSFVLIYSLALLLVGIPLLYMEMIMGQLLRTDSVRIWRQLVPCLGGIGYVNVLVCCLMSLYNSAVVSWSLSYLCHSFNYHLPWSHCPLLKSANLTGQEGARPTEEPGPRSTGCRAGQDPGEALPERWVPPGLSCLQTVPHQYFWYNSILRASGNIEEGSETLNLNLSLGSLAAWFFVFLVIVTGLRISMLMLVFSTFFPSIVLVCLFIRCLLLEGASASLKRVVTVELSALASPDLWRQAGGHVLYSLSLGMGTVINFSSKVKGNSSVQTTFWVALVNLVTSMLATTTIFLVLGYWASTSGHTCVEKGFSTLKNLIAKGVLPEGATPPENILFMTDQYYLDWISQLPWSLQQQIIHFSPPCSAKIQKEKFMDGPGLAFVAFSQAVSLFPGAPFWTIIFFLALLITGLDTLLKISEGIVLPLQMAIPTSRKHLRLFSVIICLGGFLGSLVFTSRSGNYVLSLFDDHLVPLILLIIVIFQNVALAWIYGAKRFTEEIFSELGRMLWPIFTFLWCYVTLPVLLAILVISLIQIYQRAPPYYIAWNASASQEVKQPYLKSTLGWLTFLVVLTLLPIPACPLHHWWYLQDPVNPEPLEKQLPFKKPPPESPKSLPWHKQPLKNANFKTQEEISDISARGPNLPLRRDSTLDSLWQFAPNTPRQGIQASSWFSLPVMGSLTSEHSIRSVSLPPSRQVSLASRAPDNSNLHLETTKGNLPSKSVR